MATSNGELTAQERKRLTGPPIASPFNVEERLYGSWQGGAVFQYGDPTVAELRGMLKQDGRARALEQVLTLPLRAAAWEIQPAKGDTGETQLCRDVLADQLDLVVGQMTAACVYRHSFHELIWNLDGSRVIVDEVAWRPPATCTPAFDEQTGAPDGFRQRVNPAQSRNLRRAMSGKPGEIGWVRVPAERAVVYTHGRHREPTAGLSELDAAYWAYSTRQKVMFLWFQFLEQQSLPKLLAYGNDPGEAEGNAQAIADLKASGVLGITRPGDPQAKTFDVLESSGAGAGQFHEAVSYLEQMMLHSVLAGFTDLPGSASEGRGSYALSADQSEFFLASRQAVADEIADTVTRQLLRPLVVYNHGTSAAVPTLRIGPLANRDSDRALDMLKAAISSKGVRLPPGFVAQLVTSTASYLGLDAERVAAAVQAEGVTAPITSDASGDANSDAQLARTVDGADALMRRVTNDNIDPQDALTELELAGDWNPELHPRDPATGKFVERNNVARLRSGGDLAGLDVGELQGEMQKAINRSDETLMEGIATEIDTREAQERRRTLNRERYARQREQRERDRAETYEQLLSAGLPDEEAVQEAYGVPVSRQRARAAINSLREAGYTGRGFDELARASYRDEIHARYLQAEDATRGHMLTRQGEARGVEPYSLFTGSEARARRWASEELLNWWDRNGRLTLSEWRAQLLGDPGTVGRIQSERAGFNQ